MNEAKILTISFENTEDVQKVGILLYEQTADRPVAGDVAYFVYRGNVAVKPVEAAE